MNMYVYAQKRLKSGALVAGWIVGKTPPSSLGQVKLDYDMSKALRFDVDNNAKVMNELLSNGWSLMVAGNKFDAVQDPSPAPFSS